MAGVTEVTQGMVDYDTKRFEDFDAAIARENSLLLHTLEPRDVMAMWTPWRRPLNSTLNSLNQLRLDSYSNVHKFIHTLIAHILIKRST